MITIRIDAIKVFLMAFVFLLVSFSVFAQDHHSERGVTQNPFDNSAHVRLLFVAKNYQDYSSDILERIDLKVFDSEGYPIPKVPCYPMIICPLCVCIDTTGHSLPYTLTYDFDYTGGLWYGFTTLQTVRVWRHILKIYEFTDLCQHLRMDYNEDSSISASDLFSLRHHMLTGELGPFHWIQAFDPYLSKQKPFFPLLIDELIDTVYAFNLLTKGNVGGNYGFDCQSDFTGDFEDAAEYLISEAVQINAEWKRNEDTEMIELRFSKKDSRKINAFQISFAYDTIMIEIDTVKWVENPYSFGSYNIHDGHLISTGIFHDAYSGEELFTVVFNEKENLNKDIFEYLNFENASRRQEVTTDIYYSTPVVFEFSGPLKTLNPGEFADICASPNPFSNDVTIYIAQGFKSDITLRIYDVFGRLTGTLTANAGAVEIRIPEYYFPTNGVYMLSLEDGLTRATLKVIKNR